MSTSVLVGQATKDELVELGNEYVGKDPQRLDSVADLLLSISLEDEDFYNLSLAYSFDGISSAMQGDLGPSLQSFQESWKSAVSIKDTNLQINALTNMAGVYRFAGQPEKAQEKLFKAIELLTNEDQKLTKANTLLGLGIVQEEMKDFFAASSSYKQAVSIFDKAGDMSSYLSCVEKLGSLLKRIGKLEEASALFSFALVGRENAEQIGMTIPLLRERGSISYMQNKLSEARSDLENAITLSDSINYKLLLDSTLVMLIRVSSRQGDFESVNKYTNRLVQHHQSQDEKQVEETLASLETEYQLNEQKLVNRALEAETEKTSLQVQKDRNTLVAFGAIMILLIVIAIIAFALIRRTQKFNSQLELKVEEKTQEVLLRDQQIKTTAFKLAYELRSGVATLLGAKNLLDEGGIPEGIDKDLYEAIGHSTEKLDVIIKEMIKNLEKITVDKSTED